MELKSLGYILFAAIIFFAYFSVYKIKNAQKIVLLLANISFICVAADFRSFIIITILICFSYFMGLLIERQINEAGHKNTARALMYLNVIFSVAVLCYFKFFKDTFGVIQDLLLHHGITVSSLIVPIGISYYSLSMIAYAIDIYHKKHPAEKNFIDYFVFITYFPSIIQGPVNLYKKVGPQIKESHAPNAERIIMGLQRSLWGYVKKVVVADRIGILVGGILKDEASEGILLLWAMVLYSFQIYTDFSGGIDIIMGISEVLGIELTENFKAPLLSKSVTEYWQRWHMSLGVFMEKYIYYPLVLNRKVMHYSKKIPNSYLQKVFSATLASVVVFVIVGIWHGTGWNYVVYGCYQAVFVSSAVLLGPVYKKMKAFVRIPDDSISWEIFQIIRTFVILVIGRYFIRAKDLSQAVGLFYRTFYQFKWSGIHVLFDDSLLSYGLDYKNVYLMYFCILLIILVDILHNRGVHFRTILMKQDICFRYFVYFVAIFAIIIFGIYGPEFSSASFIYQEF